MRPAGSSLRTGLVVGLLGAAVAVAWCLGSYDLSSLSDPASLSRAARRLGDFLAALGHPDLSAATLRRCWGLALTTVAIAMLGTALAVLGGLALGLAASRNVVVADARGASRGLRQAACGCARLLQDTLRGVPDFAWAILCIPILGLGPQAGVAALALNVSGILGRIYSELFDAVPPRLLEPLRAAGATRLQTFLYGILPASRSGAVSLSLLRWECAVRNAAVIGVVGGGGLGSEIFVRLNYGEYDKVLTLLFFLMLLTLASDVVSQVVRSHLHQDAETRGGRGRPEGETPRSLGGLAALLGGLALWAAFHLSPDVSGLLAPDRWRMALHIFGGLLHPDLSGGALARAVRSAGTPLSMALLGTGLAALAAALIAYPASATFQVLSPRFTGRFQGGLQTAWGAATVVCARGVALLSRAIPEVFWALLLVSFLRLGTLPGMLALALHSTGLLTRIFAESVDALPLRALEVVHAASGSQTKTFLYAAVPAVLPEWIANTFFQFESNVRQAVVLGMVGVGGLGFDFSFQFEFFRFERAGTYLLVMIALAVILDRSSRWLGLARTRLGE